MTTPWVSFPSVGVSTQPEFYDYNTKSEKLPRFSHFLQQICTSFCNKRLDTINHHPHINTMKKGILAKKIEWAKHLRPWGKREQWGRERLAEKSEIASDFDDMINGAEVVFDDQTYDIYEQEEHPPYPHI